jgi:signal transduction histidine kinase
MRTTFSRTFFPAAIILLTALLMVGASFRALVTGYLQDSTLDRLNNDAVTISELAAAYYTDESLSDRDFLVNLSVASQVSGANAVICDRSGRLMLCSDSPFGCGHQGWSLNENYVERVVKTGVASDTGVTSELYEEQRYVVSVPILDTRSGRAVGIVMVSTPMAETNRVLDKISDIYLFVALIVVLVSVIVMSFYARMQSKPLQEMARTAIAFGHGDLTARVQLDGNYTQEIDELALAFNNMASSLQKSEYQRQEFVANVSHELKTPMTTIGGYIDGILDGTIPPERSRHYMRIVSDETKRLSRLVRSMLDISRLQDQGGIPAEMKTRFDLLECVGQVLISFEQKITGKKVDVQVNMPDLPVYTQANQDYITQVVYNLVDNAVKFCPEGGQLTLDITTGRNKAYVRIGNDGQTIPPEELPLVFDRFHKMDKSRSQNRDSWGLGLYIVKTIIGAHGEDISVTSRDGKTTFTFTLPVVN